MFFKNVGWVEFNETHQFPGFMVGLAELDLPYEFCGLNHWVHGDGRCAFLRLNG
jgi:hypothetical protein